MVLKIEEEKTRDLNNSVILNSWKVWFFFVFIFFVLKVAKRPDSNWNIADPQQKSIQKQFVGGILAKWFFYILFLVLFQP